MHGLFQKSDKKSTIRKRNDGKAYAHRESNRYARDDPDRQESVIQAAPSASQGLNLTGREIQLPYI